jgi:hypothetical protein
MPSKIVLWDLKQEMRRLCPEAAKVVERCLKSEDDKIALAAAEIAFERGFGRPELHAEVEINHRFVVAPQTMPLDQWLAQRGQVQPSRWLERQQARDANATRTRASARAGPPLELTANDIPQTTPTSAEAGNGNEADKSAAEHGAIERRKLLN